MHSSLHSGQHTGDCVMVHLRPCKTLPYIRWFVLVVVSVILKRAQHQAINWSGWCISRFSAIILFFWWLPGIERVSQEVTTAGSDPFSDQSRNDVPSAFERGKIACTSAICVSSLWYTQKHTGVNPQTQMHGCTNIHTHTHLLTLPRFICQDDSWTLAAVEFARQNPSLV